ncbi:MAG: aryl-sulfate sulfotransferase [Deltaproteobacteria bacterium]|nr:aryl-sulfate sulfotransferase [Deltaproteobacteria bacterium]MBW1919111.1 aryl-sulfate sulfotransferase [Deltaproteobacteria bacterium]MBW1934328.1 aryl-sulfate sulfotransferase [Deltaproteobacteria bacterium]RLB36071.1 MAG: hypothetical protein DRH11_00545 [Deltaproteobacteria bacterium]
MAFLMVMAVAVSVYAWPAVFPTGTTLYKPDKAFNGYTLYAPNDAKGKALKPYDTDAKAFLIDMNGNVVHTWKLPFPPGDHGVLLPNGHYLMLGVTKEAAPGRPGVGKYHMGGEAGYLFELDWDGNIVFQYKDLNSNHDFDKLPNGDYIYVAWEKVPKDIQKKVRGGQKGTEFKDGSMFSTYFREVTPQGKTVWEWHAYKHFDTDIDIIGPIHPRSEWDHCNNIDVMENGNILTDFRHLDSMMVIDKKTKNIIWRWGNVAYLDKKTGALEFRRTGPMQLGTKNKTMGGPHDCNEIAPGLPGAGHFLCYDNGMYVDTSRAVEVDPKTGKVVWESASSRGPGPKITRRHFSSFISGAERLPNGNTLICAGANGRFFEVTPAKEIVWEYINPRDGQTFTGGMVFRAHRYGPDFCPQFKNLPPAKGPAVIPPSNSDLRIPAKGMK